MRLIIAGGRGYKAFTEADLAVLEKLRPRVTEVVSGGASGADKLGEKWAASHGIPVTVFEADWIELGRKAGPIRNKEMAKYADACFLVPGAKGTESMRAEARRAKIAVYSATEAPADEIV